VRKHLPSPPPVARLAEIGSLGCIRVVFSVALWLCGCVAFYFLATEARRHKVGRGSHEHTNNTAAQPCAAAEPAGALWLPFVVVGL
jgi:hypothetical protein